MKLTCPKCGSDKVIPNAKPLADGSQLHMFVVRNPDALIFTGGESEPLTARVCGDCGYTELFTENAARLYAVYQQSLKNKKP